jgi:hypothetical protein
MANKLEMLPGGLEAGQQISHHMSQAERKLMHIRNVSGSVLQDALDTWGDIWDELQGTLTHGVMVVPEAEKNFEPECGWPEFLEKMWRLKHHLDYAKRFCKGKD